MNTNRTLLLIAFICIGHFSVDFMLGIWPVFKTMAGLDLAIAGLVAGSCVVIGEGLQGYVGGLCDRGFQRALLVFGLSFACAACFFSYTSSYLLFFLLYLCTCLGSAAFHPTAASILSNLSTTNRSSVMGLFTASGMLGLGISQSLFSWMHSSRDGETAYLAAPSLVLALATLFFIGQRTGSNANSEQKKGSLTLYMRFLRIKELRALYVSMLGNQIVLWSLVFLLPDLLQERGYAPWVVFGGGHLVLMIGATLGPPLFGYVADKASTRLVIIVASTLTFISYYLLLIPAAFSVELLFVLLFMLGATLGSVPPLIWALGSQMVPQHRGVVLAFLMGFVWLFSESLGLGVSGYLATLFDEHAAAISLSIMGAVQLISCYVNMQLPKRVYEVVNV